MRIGIEHHAVLYALLVRSACEALGEEDGKRHMAAVTRLYGIRRGQRMAVNADRNNDPRDMNSFFIYGEWKGEPGENISSMSYPDSCSISTVKKCAWYDAWVKHSLTDYGTLYCRYVDAGLAEGFSGSFSLDVQSAIGKGDDTCVFRWNRPSNPDTVAARKEKDRHAYILPFTFHCCELTDTAEEYFRTHCPDEADTIIRRAEHDFQIIFNMEVPK